MKVNDKLHAFLWPSVGANNCNTYLIDGPVPILIDPGHLDYFGHVRDGLAAINFDLDRLGLVIGTHAHPDHLEAVKLFANTPARWTLHAADWELVRKLGRSYALQIGFDTDEIAPAFFLQEGTLSAGGCELQVLHTPGHSPGSICLYWPQAQALFSGDLIFKGGFGRTDLPGGDSAAVKESIRRVADLEIEILLPGHGQIVRGRQEVAANIAQLQNALLSWL